ncbi:DHRS11.2 family protein [Megaselia abdita]
MDRWINKTAVVTGGGTGIGAACCKELIQAGLNVFALGRRAEKLNDVKESLPKDQQEKFHPLPCDVSIEEDVIDTFKFIDETSNGVHILINSAGIFRKHKSLVSQENSEDIEDTIRTNVLGVVFCTREAFQIMKKKNIAGHVININSVCGHRIPDMFDIPSNIYPATKYAVTAMTDIYRQEFSREGTEIKVTSISPGLVKTDMIGKYGNIPSIPVLNAEDVSSAVMFCISRPPKVQIQEIIIRPLHERG